MNEFPRLETERLLLSDLDHADIPTIVEYAGNKNISLNTQNIPYPYKKEDAIFWINATAEGFREQRQYTFAVKLKTSGEFIGAIGLRVERRNRRAELGYWIAEPFWNRGFASEATKAVLHFGFEELELHKIFATHLEKNPASGRVMLKNGMIKEGELKEHIYKDRGFSTLIQYRLTIDEFQMHQKKSNKIINAKNAL